MNCRPNCGACCIVPSISSRIPGMPKGKPAGIRCIHLDNNYRCRLFGKEERPEVCKNFLAEPLICGNNREEALAILNMMEKS